MSISYSANNTNSGTLKKLFCKEGEELIDASKKCEELWEEMRRTDFRQEGYLNEKNVQLIYERKGKVIEDLLKINSVDEFIDVFDDDAVRFF